MSLALQLLAGWVGRSSGGLRDFRRSAKLNQSAEEANSKFRAEARVVEVALSGVELLRGEAAMIGQAWMCVVCNAMQTERVGPAEHRCLACGYEGRAS